MTREELLSDIHPLDPMYATSQLRTIYDQAGRQAVRYIEMALESEPSRILDFACGFGRVLRALRDCYTDAEITAADIHPGAIQFCAKRFDAHPVLSSHRVEEVELDGPFDLIWVGSLFTHIEDEMWRRLLPHLRNALAPQGVLVFTTLGSWAVEGLRSGENPISFQPAQIEGVLRSYDETGYGFDVTDYHPPTRAGDTIVKPEWVRDRLAAHGLREVFYVEADFDRGWVGQDAWAVRSS